MALLELIDVTKQYAGAEGLAPVSVLKKVNLEIGRGESVAIIGPSGSGKSTLLHLLGALDTPTSGRVVLNGQSLESLDANGLADLRNRQVGFVFQAHYLLPQLSLWENVLVPALAGADAREYGRAEQCARKYLERVGLSDRLGHRPAQLSGGERQRAALVRALVNGPQVLLADEPTGALDAAAAQNLTRLLLDLSRDDGVTMVVVTHSLELAGKMTRVFRLLEGQLVADGKGL
jgi:lipoprotein-releasing system ATP-binding protein